VTREQFWAAGVLPVQVDNPCTTTTAADGAQVHQRSQRQRRTVLAVRAAAEACSAKAGQDSAAKNAKSRVIAASRKRARAASAEEVVVDNERSKDKVQRDIVCNDLIHRTSIAPAPGTLAAASLHAAAHAVVAGTLQLPVCLPLSTTGMFATKYNETIQLQG
jgi:hypothetical protein